MSITYNEEKRIFKLDTSESTYMMRVVDGDFLVHLYYGAKIPDAFVSSRERRMPCASFSPIDPVSRFSPDCAPMEYGTNGAGDMRISALSVKNASGNTTTELKYTGHSIYRGKKPIDGQPSTYVECDSDAETLEIYMLDAITGVKVTLFYTAFANLPVITRRARIENTSDKTLTLLRAMSFSIDLPEMDYDLITLWGSWNMERNLERRPLAHGVQGVESKRGASGHAQNPFMALLKKGGTEEHGEAFGFNLVYSGNHSSLVECDYNCSSRVIMGINPTDFAWILKPEGAFDTPECVSVYSDGGLGKMSRVFHRFYNRHLVRGKYKHEKRPLLINSWEATTFSITTEKLLAFAKAAKELGFEMLVMDDGWFGKRDNDLSSLGDWFVNEEKLPGGLKPLVDGVHALGLKFGIWYEPEMISPDSELYRAHPDWCVRVDGREPKQGRNQLVLDMTRRDVRDYLFEVMSETLGKHGINYLKWDFNRNISDAASAQLGVEEGGEFFHRFVLGTYELIDRLVTAFPDVLFESCSGGGGRFDPAMLAYTPQIWTSDNTDAIQRLYIQFGTSMCYPASSMGAHVSASRRTPLKTRADVAMWGSFGYELDPRSFTDEEKALVREQVAEYHKNYSLVHTGDLYRLISPFENPYLAAWQLVSEDRRESLITLVTLRAQPRRNLIIRARGLDPDARYKNTLTGEITSGALLMNAGLVIHSSYGHDGESLTVRIEAVE